MKKNYFSLLCGLFCAAMNLSAQTWNCGAQGNNVTATLSDGTLTISGSGAMEDYSAIFSFAPWSSYSSSIQTVIINSGVTSIGEHAFGNCRDLTSVSIPNSVTSIRSRAFAGCSSLTSVNIPNSVTSIGSGAFENCSSLTSVNIPNSVTSIEMCAFENCSSLTSVNISNSMTSIELRAFSGCSSLTSVNIPNSVTSIESGAFRNCSSLTSVNIPNSVTSIGWGAFSGCSSLTSITVHWTKPPSIYTTTLLRGAISAFDEMGGARATILTVPSGSEYEYISADGWKDFYIVGVHKPLTGSCGTHLTWTYNPENKRLIISGTGAMTSSPWSDFSRKIRTVVLPNGLTSVGREAFQGCDKLTSIDIPASVATLGNKAFAGCTALKTVTNRRATPQSMSVDGNVFDNLRELNLIVPANSVSTYQAADGWRWFKSVKAIQ